LRYGFEHLKLERIIGLVDPENTASIRVIEKLGMTHAGVVTYHGEETLKYVLCSEEHRNQTQVKR
jgi:RimJ/RimL family protein N-acetyltransferase